MTRDIGYARAHRFLERLAAVDEVSPAVEPGGRQTIDPWYTQSMNLAIERFEFDPLAWIPPEVGAISNHQVDLPRLAKNTKATGAIEARLAQIPSIHTLHNADARNLGFISNESIHLVVTSPPYWTLKTYRDSEGQLGHISDYDTFLNALDDVWRECHRVLVPGGRVVCVVGDVCLSRRKNKGEHTVIPLHANIQDRCRRLGFTNLAPIIWHKISNGAVTA